MRRLIFFVAIIAALTFFCSSCASWRSYGLSMSYKNGDHEVTITRDTLTAEGKTAPVNAPLQDADEYICFPITYEK